VFAELLEAYHVLLDPKARQAYDHVVQAKAAKRKRHDALDKDRKRMKEDLEARERAAEQDKKARHEAEASFQAELERIRKQPPKPEMGEMDKTLKVKWKKKQSVDKEMLQSVFGALGKIDHMVTAASSALIQFQSIGDAYSVMTSTNDTLKPFECSWASGREPEMPPVLSSKHAQGDYESLTLLRMRQQQRRKMEEAIRKEEENG
jgi:DnaJ family protein C protein 17